MATNDGSVGISDIGGGYTPDGVGSSALEPWRARMDKAIVESRKIRGGNFVQIATVSEEGLPCCRTVVFRSFVPADANGGRQALSMITDTRSEKVGHVKKSPACEMVWWFSQTNEQFRIAGKLQVIGPDESDATLLAARQTQWNKLSDTAREQYWWDTPGVAFTGERWDAAVPKGGRNPDGEIQPVPDYFSLLLLWPEQVKYLLLGDNVAILDNFDSASGRWSTARVNP